MNIALIGYGKMGHEIEKIALERGHTICVKIDKDNSHYIDSQEFKNADVAIEFSTPSTALNNYLKCFEYNVPVVAGTTGWLKDMQLVKDKCQKEGKTFFYASNYSLGVNIFFALNNYLAKIMNNYPAYNVEVEEAHHIHKLDAPSGTAITLLDDILEKIDRKTTYSLDRSSNEKEIYVHCIRKDEIPGMHEIKYESEADVISIKHDAKNRKGFALGAVLAAEFIKDKKGFKTMSDMLKF